MKDVMRAAIAVPSLRLADVAANQAQILAQMEKAKQEGATVLVLPELCLCGCSCGDLVLSDLLRERVAQALASLASALPQGLVCVLGAPLMVGARVYNCAVVLAHGRILGAVAKSFGENERVFASGQDLPMTLVTLGCFTFPVGTDLLFRAADGTVLGVAHGEDCLAPISRASLLALAGAEVIVSPFAMPATVSKREKVRNAACAVSAATHSACLLVGAGAQESTADMVYSGQGLMVLNGKTVAENEKIVDSEYMLVRDIDLGVVRHDRLRDRAWGQSAVRYAPEMESVNIDFALCESDGAMLSLSRLPFIPESGDARTERSAEIFEIQSAALARRLSVVGGKAVIGISGGLDSTLAVLVSARAMEKLGLPASNITAVTMPCFGTSDETLGNALALMEALGVNARTVPIKDAVLQHFKDISHSVDDYSVTYENSQARERTQVLMDIANQVGGIVVGTGDLSEVALGWCTYNGDHMSMYGVNADVPKTLVRWVIAALAENGTFPAAKDVLLRILDTPISPELLPPDAVGKISQKTEDLVGPYALHDFFLYYAVRYQYRPLKIYEMAKIAFDGHFDGATIKHWLTVFWRRFFGQQFKRNCTPDGVKVGSICLSPRGEWQMPSDASSAEWLRELDEIEV